MSQEHQLDALLQVVPSRVTPLLFGSLPDGGLLLLGQYRHKLPSVKMALQIGKQLCSCSKAHDSFRQ
jgi:hypothetical protein